MLDHLPTDVIRQVFEYLSSPVTMCYLCRMNSVIKDLAEEDEWWEQCCKTRLGNDYLDSAVEDVMGRMTMSWKQLCAVSYQAKTMQKVVSLIHTCLNGHTGTTSLSPHFEGLIKLDLSKTCIGQQSCSPLATALSRNTSIESLILSNQLIEGGISVLTDVLVTLPALHHINLSGNRLGKSGAVDVARLLKIGRLHRLEVRNNFLGVEGASVISEAIVPSMSKLSLSIDCNNIGDAGFKMLLEKAFLCRSITSKNNSITDSGMKKAAEFLSSSPPTFESIDVSNEVLTTKKNNNNKIKPITVNRLQEFCRVHRATDSDITTDRRVIKQKAALFKRGRKAPICIVPSEPVGGSSKDCLLM